jgi:hypothetical protein
MREVELMHFAAQLGEQPLAMRVAVQRFRRLSVLQRCQGSGAASVIARSII